ncbi:hypothetical protein HUS23_08185 [Ectothiorhodospiraceae bacterium 2226]|nr:hypothetical protein HUS23_08185 [Ectothiorhodospiraceae bacterium 2226]
MSDFNVLGRPVRVELTPAAQATLAERRAPLAVEMELYFSCLIRKAVRFADAAPEDAAEQGLVLRFRPVMSQGCPVDAGTPPLVAMPIAGDPARFVPHWLKLDYRGGTWQGEFGYAART